MANQKQKDKFTMEFLQERVKDCLERAKGFIREGKDVTPVVIFGKWREGEYVQPLNLSNQMIKQASAFVIQKLIEETKADYAMVITDAYALKASLDKEEREDFLENYQPGDLAKDSRRVEVLTVAGDSILGSFCVMQEYSRNGSEIVFEQLTETDQVQTIFFGDVFEKIRAKRRSMH